MNADPQGWDVASRNTGRNINAPASPQATVLDLAPPLRNAAIYRQESDL